MKRKNYSQGDKIPGTKLTYMYEVPRVTPSRRRAAFLCECGNVTESNINHVVNGGTRSCGCIHAANVKTMHLKHGNCKRGAISGAYRSWQAMHQRVLTNPLYAKVSICADWYSFESFYKDMGDRPKGHSIERKNGKGNYEPSNCIWATDLTQAANRSTNILVIINGESKIISEWCRIYGISRYTVSTRMRNGMSAIEAITTPLLRVRK